jgi:hypothetical protein
MTTTTIPRWEGSCSDVVRSVEKWIVLEFGSVSLRHLILRFESDLAIYEQCEERAMVNEG